MNQKYIAVITYNVPHKKTQDVLFRLKARGYQNIMVLALPFVKRENPFKPIYNHRPSTAIDVKPEVLCERLKFGFQTIKADDIKTYLDENPKDAVLIAGAGLLPDDLVNNHRLINCHPGLLPHVRGLDSLKWAIHDQKPLGITCHFVDANADAGLLIEKRKLPVFDNDTFHSVAYRQYEMEIDLLVESLYLVPNRTNFPELSTTESKPTRRMPKDIEANLLKEFETYKEKFSVVN